MSLATDILRAATLLEQDAQDVKDCHTLNGEWFLVDSIDQAAKRDHDERMELAAKLRMFA